ncbi:DUF881 domain-containing protein [Mumia zhuanghuii]|uniref:DUF881 domain-containing protein n=2 Tax=Mumia TaxID=1546255 RepID=A0ABW1QK53_9ACTN|nr:MULTISPECIES: DUF881 domain-containing protein [Mumia]KAA1419795.1 DUF881 domain-containing protein [Mumia zhuanghuii]
MADRRAESGAEPASGTGSSDDVTGNSMTLLQNIIDHPLDDDYYTHEPHERSARGRTAAVVVIAFFALLITLAVLQTQAAKPEEETERAVLITQLEKRMESIDTRKEEVADLGRAVGRLQRVQAGAEALARAQEQRAVVGTIAVSGPALRVTVDNAGDSDDNPAGRVRDKDLQVLVNGLWAAGAEAIAINGNRLTAMSSIRAAGEGITVNYRSLTTPYVVTAIGNPRTLPGNFVETSAAQTWTVLKENFGMRFDVTERDQAELPAAPRRASTIRHATVLEVSDQ